MITTFLIEHPWVSTSLLVAAVVVGPPVGALLAGRPRVAWTLTALAALPVLALTLWPSPRSAIDDVRCEVAFSVPTLGRVELAANVALFVAPALLATVASRRPLLALALASATSASIEVVQALVPVLGRACSTNDWLSNTIGAATGVLLGVLALRLRDAASRRPPGRRPRTARRADPRPRPAGRPRTGSG